MLRILFVYVFGVHVYINLNVTEEPLVPRIKPPPRRNTTVAISKSNTNESVKDLVVLESPPIDDLMKNLEPFDFMDR